MAEHPTETKQAAEPCVLCERYAKTGGPSHNPSPFCESGKRPHCTCDRCW